MTLDKERARSSHQGRVQEGVDRVAVIDIGSNSIRLVVYDGLKRAPVPLFNEKVLCGLGRGVENDGRLNPDGVKQALAALHRFDCLARSMGVGRLDVLATAAVRDASDGQDFIQKVAEQTGLQVRVISGEEEARLSALGVLSGQPAADGLVGDLGGGSLELVALDRGTVGERVTLPLGPLRLMEAGKPGTPDMQKRIDQHIESLKWLGELKGRTFHPVGGGWRALAKLHMEQTSHPLHIVHQYAVPAVEMRDFAALVSRQSRSSLERMQGSKKRIDTMACAALVMERLLRIAQPSKVVFSAFGLREGHLFSLLGPDVQRQDPLLASTADWARRFSRIGDPSLLFAWTGKLFAGEDDQNVRLRHAACLLSDVAWAEHPDYRAEHAVMRILRFPFPGVDHVERAFLALTIYARYTGGIDGAVAALARSLLSDAQQQRALALGLAQRLAHNLTGGATALLPRTELRLVEERLELVLPADGSLPAGETAPRRLESLAKALGRKAAILPG